MSARIYKAPVGRLAQAMEIDSHTLLSDVDPEEGGDDLAPDPHDLLDAALGSCTALTLRMYAARQGWLLDEVEVVVSHEERPGSYRLQRTVRLQGRLTPEQRSRLLEIAERCPIHRILAGEISISTMLA